MTVWEERARRAEAIVRAVRKLVEHNSLYGSVECDALDRILDGDSGVQATEEGEA